MTPTSGVPPCIDCFSSPASLVAASAAEQVELLLTNGERLRGELVRADADGVVIRRSVQQRGVVRTMEQTLATDQVVRRDTHPSLTDQYATRSKATPDDFLRQSALARWCAEACLIDAAVRHAQRAEELEPGNEPTARLMAELGRIRRDGQWVVEADILAQQGQVRIGEQVLDVAEVERRRKAALLTRTRDELKTAVAEAEELAKFGTPEQIKALTERTEAIKQRAADSAARITDARDRQAQLEKRLRDLRVPTDETARRQQATQVEKQRTAMAKAVTDAETQARTAAEEARAATVKLAAARARGPQAAQELQGLKEKLAKVEAELATVQPAAAKADAKADAKPRGARTVIATQR